MERLELARRLGAEPATSEGGRGPVVIAAPRPREFMAAFADAVAGGGVVALADPQWTQARRAECERVLAENATEGREGGAGRGWLLVPTGGTSGAVKLARHDEETLGAAARGFGEHFGLGRVNAIGVLPLHHVSGLMAWMRAAWSGGRYEPWDWQELKAGRRPELPAGEEWTISLVPTQLQRLVESAEAVEWLRRFRLVMVGGGPVWPELADAAVRASVRVVLSYGMTETAAMVSAQRPEEFAMGDRSCGRPLPHASVRLEDEEGRIVISGTSLFRGYWPAWREGSEWETEDLGRIDAGGRLQVLGRRDAVIITGGKKVQPAAVEEALRRSGEFEDVAVIGVPDAEWGEAVVACYPAWQAKVPDLGRAGAGLAGWERPKRWVAIEAWPRNAAGKVDRAALRRAADVKGKL